MRIKYQNNSADLGALCSLLLASDKAAGRARFWRAAGVPAFALLCVFFYGALSRSLWPVVVAAAIAVPATWLLWLAARGAARRAWERRHGESFLGEHQLELASFGFSEWAGWEKRDYAWHGIKLLADHGRGLFVVSSDGEAFLIPRAGEGYEAFAAELKEKYAASQARPLEFAVRQ